jgi:biotin carboxylase
VIAVDRDPQAVAFALADERAVLSTEDEEAVERLARARRVDGIVSPGADWPVGVAARVAARIGIPHPIEPRVGAVATSKLRQREAFAAAGVPHARAFAPDDPALPLPCVVKAPDRQGQRGLTLVRRREDLRAALAAASVESRGGAVLVEELVEGPELTVNAFSSAGRFSPVTVTDRLTAEPPAFGVALAHVWPSGHDSGAAIAVARAAVEAVGIVEGPSYTQVRLGPEGPAVMEVAARLGGGHDAELAAAVTGVDLNALTLQAALGEDVGDAASREVPSAGVPGRGGGAVCFLVPPAGRLVAVDGVDAAERLPGVRWVRVYRRPGHVFGPLRRGADRAGAVLATGTDRDEALARARRAADAVRFRVDADAP